MDKAEYHGELVDFPPMMTWPKPVQKPHPAIIVGGAFRFAARRALRYGDGIIPQGSSAGSGEPEEFVPRFRQMAHEAGRDPKSLPVTLGGAPEDPRSPKAVPGSWRGTDECRLAAGQSGRDPAHAGPLGEIDPAAPLDRRPRYAQNRAVRRPQRL